MHLLAIVVLAALASDSTSVEQAQTGCTLGTLTERIEGVDRDADQTPWPVLPTNIVIDLDASTAPDKRIEDAVKSWTRVCTESGGLPGLQTWTSASGDAQLDRAEVWKFLEGKFADFGHVSPTRGHCGWSDRSKHTVYFDSDSTCSAELKATTLAHELGHIFRLRHGEGARCTGGMGFTPSIMVQGDAKRRVQAAACEAVKREVERTVDCEADADHPDCPKGGGPDVDRPNPGPGDDGGPIASANCDLNPNDPRCPRDCSYNPNHPDCDSCILNPNKPGCESVSTQGCFWMPGPLGFVCIPIAPVPGGVPGDRAGTTTQASVSKAIDYRVHLRNPARITVNLTGMTSDFNCGLSHGTPDNEDPPPAAVSGTGGAKNCTNRTGTADDSWTGLMPAGQSKLTVFPAGNSTGDYSLTVTLKPVRTLPFLVTESAISGDRDFLFALEAASQVKVSLTGMDRDIDCRVNGARCTNYGGARDDSWTGTLQGGVHEVKVYPYGGGDGTYTLRVAATTADPPAAPVLSGKVSGTLQSLA